jgi:hypothetical protein
MAAQPLAVEQAAEGLRLAAEEAVVAPVAELPAALRCQKYSEFRLDQ